MINIGSTSPGPVVTWFKAFRLELLLRDAALVRFPEGETFLASLWDRWQLNIAKNFKLLPYSGNSGVESQQRL